MHHNARNKEKLDDENPQKKGDKRPNEFPVFLNKSLLTCQEDGDEVVRDNLHKNSVQSVGFFLANKHSGQLAETLAIVTLPEHTFL